MGTGRAFRRSSPRTYVFATIFFAILFYFYLASHPPDLKARGIYPRLSVQYPFHRHGRTAAQPERAAAVKATMKDTFWKYREAAWGADEVRPISGGNNTSRNGWAATIVDGLTTLAVMGLEEEFNLALAYTVNEIDFTNAVDLVDPFETTIRYLGALVSTVDLIDAGVVSWKVPAGSREGLLRQAVTLAGKLAPSFDTPTGMLWPRVNWTTNEGCREHLEGRPYPDYNHATIGPARAGTNWLENMSLSRLTGDPIYGLNATNAWKPLVYNKWKEDWPGIIDAPWDIITGTPFERQRSWGAGHDSYYEYLIKAHILHPSDAYSTTYSMRWLSAINSTITHLLHRTKRESLLFLHQHRNGQLINEMGHLACFAGGNFMLGGAYLAEPHIVSAGADLVATCRDMYAKTATGVGPEYVAWFPVGAESAYRPQHDGQVKQNEEWEWWVSDARYFMRPETVESYFYAWRITGDEKYQTWSWEAYEAIVRATKSAHGYAEIQDVTREPGEGNRADSSESFWGAETLKYLYLAFTEDSVLSLDQWVLSTEAHPFRIQKK